MSFRDEMRHPLGMISEVGSQLDDLAYAFATTGNYIMADKLNIMSTTLNDAVININQAMSDDLDQQLNLAQGTSANVLRSTLASAEDEKRASNKKCILSQASSYYHHYPKVIFDFAKYDGNMANIKYFDGKLYHGITVPANDLIFIKNNNIIK